MTLDNVTALNARDDVLYVAHRWHELQSALVPGGGNALTGVVVNSSGVPIPIEVYVSDLLLKVTDDARFYGRVLMDEVPAQHGCPDPEKGEKYDHETRDCPDRVDPVSTSLMPGLLRDVASRYGHFTTAGDRTALDFCDAWHGHAQDVRHALEKPEPAEYLGPCPNPDHEGAGCPGSLRLRKDQNSGKCAVCEQEFTRESQGMYLADEMDGRLMTLSELTSALHVAMGHEVPYRTVQSWVRRRRLAERADGLYSFSDALTLAHDRAVRGGRVAS